MYGLKFREICWDLETHGTCHFSPILERLESKPLDRACCVYGVIVAIVYRSDQRKHEVHRNTGPRMKPLLVVYAGKSNNSTPYEMQCTQFSSCEFLSAMARLLS